MQSPRASINVRRLTPLCCLFQLVKAETRFLPHDQYGDKAFFPQYNPAAVK